jgi:hypothetical protein
MNCCWPTCWRPSARGRFPKIFRSRNTPKCLPPTAWASARKRRIQPRRLDGERSQFGTSANWPIRWTRIITPTPAGGRTTTSTTRILTPSSNTNYAQGHGVRGGGTDGIGRRGCFGTLQLSTRPGSISIPAREPGYDPTLREYEVQDPNVLAGYHRDWGTGNHDAGSLSQFAGPFHRSSDGNYLRSVLVSPAAVFHPFWQRRRQHAVAHAEFELHRGQHIYQSDWQSIIVGGRYQHEGMDSANSMTELVSFPPPEALPIAAHDEKRF